MQINSATEFLATDKSGSLRLTVRETKNCLRKETNFENYSNESFAVIGIMSRADNVGLRMAARQTWVQEKIILMHISNQIKIMLLYISFIIEFILSINFEHKKLKNTSAHYKFLVPRSDEFIKRENDQFRDVLSLSPGSREVRDGEILRAWLGCVLKPGPIYFFKEFCMKIMQPFFG